jgi:hypothetical protein
MRRCVIVHCHNAVSCWRESEGKKCEHRCVCNSVYVLQVRQPTGAIKLNESVSHFEEAAYFFEEFFEYFGLDDYDLKLEAILPAVLNVTDFDAVAEIVDGAVMSTVECTLLCQSSDICDVS